MSWSVSSFFESLANHFLPLMDGSGGLFFFWIFRKSYFGVGNKGLVGQLFFLDIQRIIFYHLWMAVVRNNSFGSLANCFLD